MEICRANYDKYHDDIIYETLLNSAPVSKFEA